MTLTKQNRMHVEVKCRRSATTRCRMYCLTVGCLEVWRLKHSEL
jgi:hypothetical protein